jgi:hypothetical protein
VSRDSSGSQGLTSWSVPPLASGVSAPPLSSMSCTTKSAVSGCRRRASSTSFAASTIALNGPVVPFTYEKLAAIRDGTGQVLAAGPIRLPGCFTVE